jgi:hypothetical protein
LSGIEGQTQPGKPLVFLSVSILSYDIEPHRFS